MSISVNHACDCSRQEARAIVRKSHYAHELFPCEHGHFECSTFDDGPCIDELLYIYPTLAN